jgi:hypothetical protein
MTAAAGRCGGPPGAGPEGAGGLKQVNRQYKAYRQGQIAKAERAMPYSKFIEPFIATMVRQVAMTGRMI